VTTVGERVPIVAPSRSLVGDANGHVVPFAGSDPVDVYL
jgi:hypothetical protein